MEEGEREGWKSGVWRRGRERANSLGHGGGGERANSLGYGGVRERANSLGYGGGGERGLTVWGMEE